ncbi:hypothetical protein Micbo1qcDRAFT_40672 [Microdochium bolleyi]|uniref:Proteophosphoglycan ppg4 n=1 Tax=Microdochium bolleyi TaxID=196109 RepID=A0A136JA41_9PEZI|nr:hypothetical protein Micbo1qcDRAFT_40672 [Microdochium bolleyi]
MGNTASVEALHKEPRLRNRFSRVPAASAPAASPTRRSSAAKERPAKQLDDSETPSDSCQHDAPANPGQQSPIPSLTHKTDDLERHSSVLLGQPRPLTTTATGNDHRTWSLGAHESRHQPKRNNSLTRTFSLSRARSLIHQHRSNSFSSDIETTTGHEQGPQSDAHVLDLVAEQPLEDNPYLRTATSQCFEPWKPPVDIPRRPSSTGLPLLPRPDSATDMSLFTPTRRRSLRTPGVATRGPPSTTGRTSKPPSRRNSLARTQPLPILEVSAAAEDDDYDGYLTMPMSIPRASTPNELDFAQVGAYKFGTLRITNGSPAGTPDVPHTRKDKASTRETADYFSAAPASPWQGVPSVPTGITGSSIPEPVIEPDRSASVSSVERLDVRLDDYARSAGQPRPNKESAAAIKRVDSGIETTPVYERPEMRLSKADSGYSSKASIRSSYSDNRPGKEPATRPSFESSHRELAAQQGYTNFDIQYRLPSHGYIAGKPEIQQSVCHTTSMEHQSRPPQPYVDDQCDPQTAQKLRPTSRRQPGDGERADEMSGLIGQNKAPTGDPSRSHYHWKRPALSSGKGTLNSLFGLKRVDHEPLQATPFPPQRSKLSKENRKSQNLGGMGTNLVHAATAMLPKKKTPTLHLKTELNTKLQQDDQLDQDPRFSVAISPRTRSSIGSATTRPLVEEHLLHDRQVQLVNRNSLTDPARIAKDHTQSLQPYPYVPRLTTRNSYCKPESPRNAPPPVSLKTRHGSSFTSMNDWRSRQSLPAHVERGISLDQSEDAPWQFAGRASSVSQAAKVEPADFETGKYAIADSDDRPLSPVIPQIERRRSMIISAGQGQHRVPQWDVDADHHATHIFQLERQQPLSPQLRRPSSASSFSIPRIPEKSAGRQMLAWSRADRPTTVLPSAPHQEVSSTVDPNLRNSIHESAPGARAFALSAGRASSQGRGHSRNRSHGSFDRDGNPVQFRVLHSYHSPAYKNVPVWR